VNLNDGQGEVIKPFVVMEFAEHGNLFNIVRKHKLPAGCCRNLFKQLLAAIKHLNEKEIAHRDIKL